MKRTNGNQKGRPPRGLVDSQGGRVNVYAHLARTLANTRRSLTLAELIEAAAPAIRKIDASYSAHELMERARLFFEETTRRMNGRGGGGAVGTPYPVFTGGIVFGEPTKNREATLRYDENAKTFGASAALDRLAEKLKALPAERREAFERDVLKLSRKGEQGSTRAGRPPVHGETMSHPILVRATPAMRRDMERAAERLGAASVPDYLRKLHDAFMAAERLRPEDSP